MLTAMVVGWKLGQGMEFAPAVVLGGVGGALGGLLGAWTVAALLASAALYWFVRATVGPVASRRYLILAGRIALTLAVPAGVAGMMTGNPDRTAYSLIALVAVAAVQQVVSAGLERGGESACWLRKRLWRASAVPPRLGFWSSRCSMTAPDAR